MRIRLEGTEAEMTAAVERLATVLEINEVSDFYPNRRRGTKYLPAAAVSQPVVGRVYLTVTAPAPQNYDQDDRSTSHGC